MSTFPDAAAGETPLVSAEFYRLKPRVLRVLIEVLGRAVAQTVVVLGGARVHEPMFTRQLKVELERARDATPNTPRYDITHQPEQEVTDADGRVTQWRRLDLRILFAGQLGRQGDYLCLECKYLDARDRHSDREYVDEGVERIVIGDYAKGHSWAVMVGLERVGPLHIIIERVDARLRERYGVGFKPIAAIRCPNVRESEHIQAGGPHCITIAHAFFDLTRA